MTPRDFIRAKASLFHVTCNGNGRMIDESRRRQARAAAIKSEQSLRLHYIRAARSLATTTPTTTTRV